MNEVEPLLTSLGNLAKASCVQEGHYFKDYFRRKRLEIVGHLLTLTQPLQVISNHFKNLLQFTSKLDEIRYVFEVAMKSGSSFHEQVHESAINIVHNAFIIPLCPLFTRVLFS